MKQRSHWKPTKVENNIKSNQKSTICKIQLKLAIIEL